LQERPEFESVWRSWQHVQYNTRCPGTVGQERTNRRRDTHPASARETLSRVHLAIWGSYRIE